MAALTLPREHVFALNQFLVVAQANESDEALHIKYDGNGYLHFSYGHAIYAVRPNQVKNDHHEPFTMDIGLADWFVWTMGRSADIEPMAECATINGEPFPYHFGQPSGEPDQE